MSWLNRFLMSLAATTVSIVLTFGTTVILDRKKQKEEKREMVMMVMYDMYNSLKSIEKADSTILLAMDMLLGRLEIYPLLVLFTVRKK